MVVFSRVIEDSADEELVADAVATHGRSVSAPPCFAYQEAIKPVNVPQEVQPKKSKRKQSKRKYNNKKKKKRSDEKVSSPLEDDHMNTEKPLTSTSSEASLIRGRADLENLLTMKLQVAPVVDGPLIVNGACAARPSRAEMLSVEAEEPAVGPAGTVITMADGSRFNFPAAPSSHRRMGSSPIDDDSRPVDEASWSTSAEKGGDYLNGEKRVEEPSQVLSRTCHTHSYSSEGHQECTSCSCVLDSASDPGHPGRIDSAEPSCKHIHIPDSEKYHHKNSSMSSVVEDCTGGVSSPDKGSNPDSMSSFTEPGSPSARFDEDCSVAGSVSTTSYRKTSGESTLILNHELESISDPAEPVAQAASPTLPPRNKITYIIVNNETKQAAGEQSSGKGRTGQVDKATMPPLSTHLQDMLASGKFSDSQIVLNSASEMFWSITFNTHRVIIDQNPVLSSMLDRAAALEQSKSAIYLMAGKKFALPRAVEFALQNLYDMSLINKDSIEQFTRKALGWDAAAEKLSADMMKEVAMDLTLCYGAAGAFLNDARIVQAAFELALQLLDWANLEIALHFGIFPDDFLLRYDESSEKKPEANIKKGNKGKKKKSQRKKAATAEAKLPPIHDNLNAEVIQKWAPKLASAAVQFLANNLPRNFLFDRLALSKELQDRMPHHLRSGCSIATLNPSLTSLTFGAHPQPSVNCTRASAILLALPFLRFREFFEATRQGKNELSGDLLKAILQEREQRRVHALREFAKKNSTSSNKKKSKNNTKDYPDWFKQELGYQEFAIRVQTREEEGNGVEFSLHREWKGNANGGPIIRKFS